MDNAKYDWGKLDPEWGRGVDYIACWRDGIQFVHFDDGRVAHGKMSSECEYALRQEAYWQRQSCRIDKFSRALAVLLPEFPEVHVDDDGDIAATGARVYLIEQDQWDLHGPGMSYLSPAQFRAIADAMEILRGDE